MEVTFLGTGTSQGIPIIACDCPVCRSDDPRDRRTRTSILVTVNDRHILIDCTPELRLQCLACGVRRVDAVLVTHTHADHVLGMDDLRRFNQVYGMPIEVYALPDHIVWLREVFGYAEPTRAGDNPDLPKLIFRPIDGTFNLFGLAVQAYPVPHGQAQSTVYRLGPLAYCTDISAMPDVVLEALTGIDTLVLGALRPEPHPAHLSLEQALELARRIGARQTWFVHMGHQVSHAAYQAVLPPGVALAYDGLKVSVRDT